MQKYLGHAAEVVASQFISEREDKVCSISVDTTARVFQAETGQEMFVCMRHKAEIVALQADAIGNLLVTGSFDKTLVVWDIRTPHK